MGVGLVRVRAADAAELRAMVDPYLVDHADLVDPQRVQGDPTDQPYFDLYWTEADRTPLWILADGRRAGFVLINAWSPSGLGTERAIAEFCMLPEHRRAGLGLEAARAAFATHAGQWELQVYRANAPGLAFWPRAIEAAGARDRQVLERGDRVIHRFRT